MKTWVRVGVGVKVIMNVALYIHTDMKQCSTSVRLFFKTLLLVRQPTV